MAVAVVLCLGAATVVDAADQTGQATNGAGLEEAATRRIPVGSSGRNEMVPTADPRRLFDEVCLIGTLFACPSGEAGSAAAERAVPPQILDQLTELSLEELLQVRLPAVNPMGIGHIHRSGEWMVGYQFMSMRMRGNREGTTRLTENQMLARYPATPTSMDMDMHMFMVMYGASDRLTFDGHGALPPSIHRPPDPRGYPLHDPLRRNRRRPGERAAVLLARGSHEAHAFLLLDAPTGSIREEDVTPAGRVRLPYPMQSGSGTWNLAPGVTFTWAPGIRCSGAARRPERSIGTGTTLAMRWATACDCVAG